MEPIPLINLEHVARISGLLEEAGVRPQHYMERAGLSPDLREHPVGFAPGHNVWNLVDLAERGEGLGDWWLDIARTADWHRAGWVRPMTRAATLGEALRIMCASYVRQIPMNQLGISFEGPTAWFWRRRIADVRDWKGGDPAEQYTLSFMLEAIRAGAGAAWLPERLKVESARSGWIATTDRFHGVQVEHDQPLLAVAIPLPLLALPVSISVHEPAADAGPVPAADFHGSLRQILEALPSDLPPCEERAAGQLEMSTRTLRRRLREEGTTFREITREILFANARARLAERGLTIREIAEALGYADAAHFTRFFRRRAGVPPSVYREHLADAPARASAD